MTIDTSRSCDIIRAVSPPMKNLLLVTFVLVWGLGACASTPKPQPTAQPTAGLLSTSTPLSTSPTQPAPTNTPNVFGMNIIAQFDPTSQVLTIYGLTPAATVVLGNTPLSRPPTAAATMTPEPTETLAPTDTPPPVVVVPRATPVPTQPLTAASLKGKIIFKSARNGGAYPDSYEFYYMNKDGSSQQPLDFDSAKKLYASLQTREGYSPDGSKVVVGEKVCFYPPCFLYILDPVLNPTLEQNTASWTPPTGPNHAQKSTDPAWSPDGQWIAFVGNWENARTANIFKGTAFKSPPTFRQLTNITSQADTRHPTYSPDGGTLAYATQVSGRWQIWVLDPNGTDPMAQDFTRTAPQNISSSNSDDWDPIWVK